MICKDTMQQLQTDYDSLDNLVFEEAAEELRFIEKMLIDSALRDKDSYGYIIQSQDVRVRREIYNTLVALDYRVELYPVDAATPDWPTGHELMAATSMDIYWWG